MDAERELTKAKLDLLNDPGAVFFSHVMLGMKHSIRDGIPTAMTDGLNCYYGRDFFMEECTRPQRVGLVLHETFHPAMDHMYRCGDRDPLIFNKAADYAINLMITDAGFELPDCGLLDERFRGMSAEQIYDIIKDEEDQGGDLPMEDIVYGDPNNAQAQQIQEQVQDILISAAMKAKEAGDKAYGNIPGALKREIEKWTNPVVPWHRILAAFMQKWVRDEYSYNRLNKRFMPDVFLPTLHSPGLSSGAIICDVSGSILHKEWQAFVSNGRYVFERFQPDQLWLGQFDTQFHAEQISTLQQFDRVKFKGGGGTRIDPVLGWLNDTKPNWAVIFTDGHFRQPSIKTKVPIVWVIHDNKDFSAPFGKTIHFQMPSH